jgi:hypothetical protein
MNLAWKRQHEELTGGSSRPSTKYFFPYRTQFQIIGPHRQASWANRRVGPPVSVSLIHTLCNGGDQGPQTEKHLPPSTLTG